MYVQPSDTFVNKKARSMYVPLIKKGKGHIILLCCKVPTCTCIHVARWVATYQRERGLADLFISHCYLANPACILWHPDQSQSQLKTCSRFRAILRWYPSPQCHTIMQVRAFPDFSSYCHQGQSQSSSGVARGVHVGSYLHPIHAPVHPSYACMCSFVIYLQLVIVCMFHYAIPCSQ